METPAPQPSDEPRAEYVRRLDAWKTTQAIYESQHRRLGGANLALGGVTLVVVALALAAKAISILWVLAPLAAIVALALVHGRVLKKRERCSRTVAYYERALARIDNRWMGTGESGERFHDATHPYSRDLDLFGAGSLFELLCATRTQVGQETLAQWLLTPASPDHVRSRQEAAADLRTRLDLREDLAVLAEEAGALAPAESLAAWGDGHPLLASTILRIACALLAVLWLVTVVVWLVRGVAYPAVLVSIMNVGVNLAYRQRMERAIGAVETAARNLKLLAGVLARLEAERFASPRLTELRESLRSEGRPPSQWIARLNRLMEYLDSRRNLIVGSVDLFVLWTLQSVCAVELWRKHTGPAVRRWLSAVGEFEALSSLGGYAYEHPADVLPEFTETSPCFDAEGLAHPLLPERDAVRNDLHFGDDLRVLIISGPNMAGKSTLVRAVGINAVLRCERAGCAFRRSPWAHRSACSIRCKAASRGSMRKSGA